MIHYPGVVLPAFLIHLAIDTSGGTGPIGLETSRREWHPSLQHWSHMCSITVFLGNKAEIPDWSIGGGGWNGGSTLTQAALCQQSPPLYVPRKAIVPSSLPVFPSLRQRNVAPAPAAGNGTLPWRWRIKGPRSANNILKEEVPASEIDKTMEILNIGKEANRPNRA